MNVLDARTQSHQLRKSQDYEVVIDGQGTNLAAPEPVQGQAFYPGGDAPKKEYSGTTMERTTEALGDLAQTTGSMGVGAVSGGLGFFGDVGSLIGGLASALFPGDQNRIEAATETMTKISETIGSERFLGMYRDFINNQADLSQEDKKMMLDAAEVGSFMSIPGAGVALAKGKDVIKEGVVKAGQAADARIAERAADTGVTLTAGADPMPVIDETLSMIGRSVRPSTEEMKTVLDARAEQMKLPVAKRTQPRTDQPLFDLDYEKTTAPQKETPVPRAPEGKPLPKFNRGAKVIEMSDKIADVLAERAKPFVGTNVQFFYHTGPIIDKAVSLGIPEKTARAQLRKFAENYAATSPRTKTEDNLRSASIVTAKQKAGLELSDIIGPGGEGINEKGYPMMIGPGGIHQRLVDDAAAGGFNFNTNPKPATFVENVSGNFAGVTADTHAIRAVFSAMNEIEPGSVPIQFIGGKTAAKTKELRAQYEADPSSLNVANMIDDTLASQKINGESVQTEYAIFSDIYKKVAEKLGVQPAEAQSLSWFANGEKTGLGSAPKTIVELIDERVDVTAQALNQPKDEVFKKFMQGSIPLLSLGGVTLLDTGAAQTNTEAADGQDT